MMRVPGSYIHTLHKSTGRSVLYGEYYCPPWAYRQGPARRLPCAEHSHTGNLLAESPSAARAMLSPSDAPNRGGAGRCATRTELCRQGPWYVRPSAGNVHMTQMTLRPGPRRWSAQERWRASCFCPFISARPGKYGSKVGSRCVHAGPTIDRARSVSKLAPVHAAVWTVLLFQPFICLLEVPVSKEAPARAQW